MYHYTETSEVKASEADMRKALRLVVKEYGGFPIALRNDSCEISNEKIWTKTDDGHIAIVSTQRRLNKWPMISLRYSYVVGFWRFQLDQWMPDDWRTKRFHFIGGRPSITVADTMIADDPLALANVVIANVIHS